MNRASAYASIILIGLGMLSVKYLSSDLGLFLMFFGAFQPIILGDFWDKVLK